MKKSIILFISIFFNVVIFAQKEDLNNRLIEAVNNDSIEVVKLCIAKGADVNYVDSTGRTPLHWATGSHLYDIAEFLISNGAKVNAKDREGSTPLMYTGESGDLRICYLLYKNGADLKPIDSFGRSAYDYAKLKGYLRIAEFLKNPKTYSEKPTCMEYLMSSVGFTEKLEFFKAIELIKLGLDAIEKELEIKKIESGISILIGWQNSIANQYLQIGEYDKASFYLNKSIDLFKTEIKESDSVVLYSTYIIIANYQVEVGKLREAQDNYEKIISYLERTSNTKDGTYTRLLNSLGLVYQKNGDFTKALEYCQKAMESMKTLPNVAKNSIEMIVKGSILINTGLNYTELQQFDKSLELFNEALIFFKENYGIENNYYITTLSNLGYVYGIMGNYEKEKQFYMEVLVIEERLLGKESKMYAITLNNLGLHYERISDYKNAEIFWKESLAILEKIVGKNTIEYITSLNNLAFNYYNLEDFQKSEELFNELKQIFNTTKFAENPIYIKYLNNYSLLKFKLGQYSEVEKMYQNALKNSENSTGKTNTTYALILNNLGLYYYEIGSYDKAKKYIEEAINVQKIVLGDFNIGLATFLNNLGLCNKELDLDSIAIESFEKALQINNKIFGDDNPNLIVILNNLAMLNMNIGNYYKSEDYFIKALKIENDNFGNSNTEYAMIAENLAQLYIRIKNYDWVKKLLNKSIEINTNKLGKENIKTATSIWLLAKYNLRIDSLFNAESFILKSTNIIKKTIQDNFKFLSKSERELNWDQYEYIFNDHCPSYSLNYYTHKPSISTFAYDNTLFTKGLLLNTTLQIQNAVLQSGDTALINTWENLRGLKRTINILQSKPMAQQGDLSVMEAQADSLDKVLTKKSQLYKQSQSDMQVKWTDIQKNLKPNEAAIEFINFNYFNKHYTDSTMYCALVLKKDSKYPEMIPLFEEKQLDSLFVKSSSDVNQLYTYRVTNLRKDTVESTLTYGSKLYNLVWKPLEVSLKNTKTLYYAPSGKLNQVAFAAIPVDSTSLLSDKYNLHQVTSTRQVIKNTNAANKLQEVALFGGIQYELDNKQMAQVQPANATTYNRSVFVADSTQRSNSFNYLKGTDDEVKGIANEFSNKGLTDQLYTGAVASEAAFKKLSGTNTDIVHIATHGFYLPVEETKREEFRFMGFDNEHRNVVVKNPLLRSGLVMAGANRAWRGDSIPENWEDGILTAHEISQINLTNTELVVLSACETGLGDNGGSEGVFGLQRAFKMAGVQTLIMSLWKVPDTQTSQLMQGFYKYWLGGMTKHDAFKKAQNEVRAANPNPYYWAAFVMVD